MRENPLSKTSQAFTLIEVLVVIFVFGIGIVSIVTLITYNLSLTHKIHLQNTAMSLTREAIELSYNYRDTNNLLGYEWNCATRLTVGSNSESNNLSNCSYYFWTGGSSSPHRFTIEGAQANQHQVIMKPLTTSSENLEELRSATKLSLQNYSNKGIPYSTYGHNGTEPTPYGRYVEFEPIKSIPPHSPLTSSDIHHVTAVVLYPYKGKIQKVQLESFIANIY